MDVETSRSESIDLSVTNTDIDDDTNKEKESITTVSDKQSSTHLEKDNKKSTDNEPFDINKEITANDISTDVAPSSEVSSRNLNNGIAVCESLSSQVSTDVGKLFDDEDDSTERTETEVTQTTDYTSSSTFTKLDETLTAKSHKSIFNILEGDDEFEEDEFIAKISEPSVEEEEPDDIFGYLKGFSCAAVNAPSLALLERQANEDELHILCEQQALTRQKYALLNKKISEYYRKKKVDRVFADISPDFYNSMIEKYERKVDEFIVVYNAWMREKSTTDREINDMNKLKTDQEAHLKKNLKALTVKEKEIGNILLETGAVQEKVVERLISRQKIKSGKMALVRIAYIKQRDKVKKIELRIKELETIGGNFHLMDFEQLRMENTIYSDKIEERDEELMRLRDRYSHAIQALAHIREKCSVMEANIEDTKEENVRTEEIVSEIRENLNDLKIERDNNRSQTHKLKVDSGLLNYPSLLIDMESSLKIADVYKNELERIQAAYKENRNKLKAIRCSIEQQTGKNTNIWFKRVIRTSKSSSHSQQIRKVASQKICFETLAQYDNTMTAMKAKLDKIFADKNCCPQIPKTTIIETMNQIKLSMSESIKNSVSK